jgi:hypothetical protein
MRPSGKEPRAGSFHVVRDMPSGKAIGHAGAWRKGVFWLSAALLFVLAYFVMAPDAPNLPTPPEQGESAGRTAY